MEVRDLWYTSPKAALGRVPGCAILRGVHCDFASHECTAVMGPSGCGKSTLLEVVGQRRVSGTASGSVLLDGTHCKRVSSSLMAFAAQDCESSRDETLSTLEALTFAAELRRDAASSAWDVERCVRRVVRELELDACCDTRLGALSGGESRRVAIGEELVGGPRVLLADELTTGLDSASAVVALRVVRTLASSGVTVATSLHQPPFCVFDGAEPLVERLVLLVDGETAYQGPAKDALATLRGTDPRAQRGPSNGADEQYSNVADAWLEVLRDAKAVELCVARGSPRPSRARFSNSVLVCV